MFTLKEDIRIAFVVVKDIWKSIRAQIPILKMNSLRRKFISLSLLHITLGVEPIYVVTYFALPFYILNPWN